MAGKAEGSFKAFGGYDQGKQNAVFNRVHKSISDILKRRDGKKNEQAVIEPVKKIQAEEQKRDVAVPQIMLRYQPIQGYSAETVKIIVRANVFFDEKLNKAASGFPHQYEVQKDGKVVYDHTSGLMWQQSGSAEKMPYKKTKAYIDTLNSQSFAGYRDWRLPTLEEVMSLVELTRTNGDLYIDSKFDTQRLIWTSDTYSASSAWVVGFDNGYCSHNDFKYGFYVSAVR